MKEKKNDMNFPENAMMPREELQTEITDAYHGVILDEENRKKIRENILIKSKKKSRTKLSYTIAAAAAVLILFLGLDALIIGLNLKHGNPVEDSTETGEEYTTEKEKNQEGEIIYIFPMYFATYKGTGNGYYMDSSKDFTAQVVLTEISGGNAVNLDENMNPGESVTGIFEIRIVDKNGKMTGSINLESSASSEYGISINLDEESMEEYFFIYGDILAFRYPIGEENGQKRYLTSLYGIDAKGSIFQYDTGSLPENIQTDSSFELVVSDEFFPVANESGLFYDYLIQGDESRLVIYNFNVETHKIELYQQFEGGITGDEIEIAKRAFDIKYSFLHGIIPVESEDMLEVVVDDQKNFVNIGYQQVDLQIASNEKEFLDYIENSVTSLSVLGFGSREDLRKKFFEESVDLSFQTNDKEILSKNVPLLKQIDGKLGYCYVYNGVSWKMSDKYVSVDVDSGKKDVYFYGHNVDESSLFRAGMVCDGNGVWKAEELEQIEIVSQRIVPQEEITVNILREDMDYDGIDDYIVTSITGREDSEQTYKEMLADREMCYVRVYKGSTDVSGQKENFDDKNILWSIEMNYARPGNGQVLLVRRDGKAYILTGRINEQMGEGNYTYEVLSLENGTETIVDEYSVSFLFEQSKEAGPKRKDVVPQFREHIEEWFGDAVLIVSMDINDKEYIYISAGKNIYNPAVYYDAVWEREDFEY